MILHSPFSIFSQLISNCMSRSAMRTYFNHHPNSFHFSNYLLCQSECCDTFWSASDTWSGWETFLVPTVNVWFHLKSNVNLLVTVEQKIPFRFPCVSNSVVLMWVSSRNFQWRCHLCVIEYLFQCPKNPPMPNDRMVLSEMFGMVIKRYRSTW